MAQPRGLAVMLCTGDGFKLRAGFPALSRPRGDSSLALHPTAETPTRGIQET